ncbi:MAG: hypothetical protein BRC29_02050 [Nanohaloarchaea archaeon SW_7_43_1]|nr:MAG: hypothetical protein BRC29_02050 [Nanohaloarchaea archaeon SW_7_43_1]
MVNRKGVGYIIEVMASMLIMFGFIAGNVPSDPATDWNNFQKEISAQDIMYTLEESGDTTNFIKEGETGSLVTAAETFSRGGIKLSGSIENIPLTEQVVGFNILENNRFNASLDTVQNLGDQCYQNDDLGELDSKDETLRTENPKSGAYIYVLDTDPSTSGGTKGYDTVWVDNKTRCQFSSSEGPYYKDEFIYWGDGTGGDYWDINEIYSDTDKKLELFNSTQVISLRPELESRVNGMDTGVVVDTLAADREDLGSYDILVFRDRETIENGILNGNPKKIKDFMSAGSVLLMMDLEKTDFYGGGSFINDTGLKWVELPHKTGYRGNPGDSVGGSYGDNPAANEVETYFKGREGDIGKINLTPSGNVTSSKDQDFKKSESILSTEEGSYRINNWNSTNSSMKNVDPSNVDSYPSTACVEDGETDRNLTKGTFEFENYEDDNTVEYEVINTKLGEDKQFCQNNVRALNIDFDRNNNFGDKGEGPYLNGESVTIKNKVYSVYFPSKTAIRYGNKSTFVYTGNSNIENINYRTSFEGFEGRKLARIGYKDKYNQDEKRMISALIHWLSEDSAQFGEQARSVTSTESVGAVKEDVFIPYKISMRWN